MTWGNQTTNTTTKTGKADDAPKTLYNREYYRILLDTNRQTKVTHRMALVAHENACKTGLARSFLEP